MEQQEREENRRLEVLTSKPPVSDALFIFLQV